MRTSAGQSQLAPILDRLGLDRSNWVKTVREFGRMFKQAAGLTSEPAEFERPEASPRAGRVTASLWIAPYCDPPKQASSAENARFRSRAFVGRALNRHPDAARWLRE